jgi:hypothetical protein
MPWGAVPHQPGRLGEPCGHVVAMMGTDLVTDPMHRPDVRSTLPVHVCEEGAAVLRPRACLSLALDPASTGLNGGHEVEGASALVRGLTARGPVLPRGGPGWGQPRTRRQRGRRSQREDDLSLAAGTRGELDHVGDRGLTCGLAGGRGLAPARRAPGLPGRRGHDPADGRGRDVGYEPGRDERSRQFGTIPWREATAEPIRAFPGPAHARERALRGANRPWRHGPERQPGPPTAGPATVWPLDARQSVGRQPLGPRRSARAQPPSGA